MRHFGFQALAKKTVASFVLAGLLGSAWIFAGSIPMAHAVPIPGLFNTGVDGSGTVLPGNSADPHYTLSTNFLPGFSTAIVTSSIHPNWLANNSVSKWIAPAGNANADFPDPVGNLYIYTTTFDLTGLDPSTATITGGSLSDNGGTIFLNGANTGFSPGFWFLASVLSAPFTINTGFVAGVNTLEFKINNEPFGGTNPTGLRVELTGTADAASAPIPEPSTILLLGSGIVGLIGYRIRKAQA